MLHRLLARPSAWSCVRRSGLYRLSWADACRSLWMVAAPIDGLELTVDLDVGGRVYSATGPLGPVPQPVSTEHPVMRALLDEDVRDQVSGAQAAILRARVGHLSVAAWELERLVRPCWWDVSSAPKLLSEQGPLRFGIVSADDPVRAPAEGSVGSGTYLLAPVALDELEFNAAAPFATLCIAPSRTQLHALAIPKPKLQRRRRGNPASVGLEDLMESYLRWSLAETRSAIGETPPPPGDDSHRGVGDRGVLRPRMGTDRGHAPSPRRVGTP